MNIQSAVIKGTNILKSRSIQTAQLDAEILMAKVLNSNRELLTKEMVREVCLKIRRVESSKVNLDLFDAVEIES